MLRSDVEPASLASAMRSAVTATDAEQPLFDVETMEQRVANAVAPRRLMMLLTACFAMLAVVLSGVGVYGVFAYSVSQRTAGDGHPAGPRRLPRARSAACVRTGVAVDPRRQRPGCWGCVSSLSKWLSSMLVGVTGHDPVSLSAALALMTVIALLASMIPAAQAARTDLISVLHSE